MRDENIIVDSNCVLTTNQSMVEWEKQEKKVLLPRIWNPQLIHLRGVLRDKNGDCKAVILSALTKVENKHTCD